MRWCFCEGDECPRKYSHSAEPLGNWKESSKPQRGWNLSSWASFVIAPLSSCLPISESCSLVVCDLGGIKVERCCYLKLQMFLGLLGYNTEHLIPLISSFTHHLDGWILFFFSHFSLSDISCILLFYEFSGLFGSLQCKDSDFWKDLDD